MEKRQILTEQLGSPDEEMRRLAVVGLAAYPLADVRESLLLAMGDGSWRVRKEAVDALLGGPVGEEIMETLVGMLAAHDNAGLRNSSVEALERLGSLAVPVLSRHINDDDHDVRKFVVDILGNIGDAAAGPLLITALDDPDPNVSAAAAENLGKIADPQGVPHLVKALAKNDVWLRYTVLEALSRIGRPVPMDVVAPLVSENLLKKAVFDCLGVIGGAEAVPILVEGLKEKVKNAREAAITALVKVRERLPADLAARMVDARLRELAGSPFVEGLLVSVESADRVLKEAIVSILGLIGDERATARLLHGCRDDRLRKSCLLAFENMGEPGTTSLINAFPAADDEERCFIVYVCGELRYRGGGSILRDGMRSDSPLLRKVSALAAGKIGLTSLIDDLVCLLDDGEPDVREGAIEALSRLAEEGRDAVLRVAMELAGAKFAEQRRSAAILFAALGDAEKLSLLIKDEDALVRKAAIASLAELKSSAGVSHLVMALADEDADVRIAAAVALGEIGGDEVLEPLLLALRDEDSWVKCAALKSLGRLGSERALSAIIAVLECSQGLELIAALEAAAEIGGEKVGAIVRQELENPDEEVVKTSIGILARGGDEWIDAYAEKLLSHPHWDVRRSFVSTAAAQRGAMALPLLASALATETDDLVKETIADLMERLQ
ncbi:MAG TPA: HEAT repeat domain-containing protein [Geobacteraceae bacterium]